MRAEVLKAASTAEFQTDERCHILEVANNGGDEFVSIARARVEPGVTTQLHHLIDVAERYVIVSGAGRVELDGQHVGQVSAGDVVRVPPGIAQRITNSGSTDLIFFCICSPPFSPECYVQLED